MADKFHPRAARIVAAGNVLAGDRWQSAMSKASGVSQSYLAMIASGERPVTDEVEKIARGLQQEADRMFQAAKRLEKIAGTILQPGDVR